MILDNVDSDDTLEHAWPGDANGSLLITARDNTIGFGKSITAYPVPSFDETAGVRALLHLTGLRNSSEREDTAAREIVQSLGGLPLAINQIAGFIVQQRMSLAEFMPCYERNSVKVDQYSLRRGENEHTLRTVWELALDCLPPSSSSLQNLLAFLDPDRTLESVLLEGAPYLAEEDFAFLLDEME